MYPYVSTVAGGTWREESGGNWGSLGPGLSLKDTAQHGQGLHVVELAIMGHSGREKEKTG